MAVALGVMIEGQEGLDWDRWRRITASAHALGFDSLWRSDHLFSVMGEFERETLALWPSLTSVALDSDRLEFGPLVSPVSFRDPVHLAYNAVALDRLSGGRFRFGVGAGWNEAEHQAFGYSLRHRMERFEEALEVMTRLWSGEPVHFAGKHYHLDGARAALTPLHDGRAPMVIGGGGEVHTLRLVARYADEWNMTSATEEVYARKAEVLARHCRDLGRDPATIRRSLMVAHIVGRDETDLHERAAWLGAFQPALRGLTPSEVLAHARGRGWLAGTAPEVVEQIRARGAWGIDRIMLQTLNMDDHAGMELIATEVMPRV